MMFDISNDYEALYEEEIESYVDSHHNKKTTKSRKLWARRRIETLREQKKLKRELEDFYYN